MAAMQDLDKAFFRIKHILEVKERYEDDAVADTLSTDINNQKTAVEAQATALQAYIDTNLGGSDEDLDPIVTALNNIATALGTIKTTYDAKPTALDVQNACDKIAADTLAQIQAGQDNFPARAQTDPKCQGKGWYYKSQQTGNPADANIKVNCDSCGGWGYIVAGVSNTPSLTFPVQEAEPDEVDQS